MNDTDTPSEERTWAPGRTHRDMAGASEASAKQDTDDPRERVAVRASALLRNVRVNAARSQAQAMRAQQLSESITVEVARTIAVLEDCIALGYIDVASLLEQGIRARRERGEKLGGLLG